MVDNNDHAHVVEQCSSSFVSGNTLGSQNRGAALAKLAVVDREAPINDGKHGRGKVSVLVVLDGTQRSTEVSGSCQNLWRVSRFLPSTCDLAATTRHRRCCPRKFIRSSASNSQKSLTSLSLSLSLSFSLTCTRSKVTTRAAACSSAAVQSGQGCTYRGASSSSQVAVELSRASV